MSAANLAPAIFITGTDTGVGKTIVAAAIARHLLSKGLKVGVMKPVETGVEQVEKLGQDGMLLRWAASAEDPDNLISPYRLSLPASPHQAAQKEQVKIDSDVILDAFWKLRAQKDILLVEGAGGLMVPLRGGLLMADLVKAMEIPCLVVTHPKLGTINHTLLTTFAARTLNLDLCGLIINSMPEAPDEISSQAPHLLASLASCDLLGVLPLLPSGNQQETVSNLAQHIETMPTYPWLLRKLGM